MGDGQHYVLVNGYDGAAALTNAGSVSFGFVPGVADAGAYEFRGVTGDTVPVRLTATTPAAIGEGGVVPQGTRRIDLTFSEALNSIDARAAGNFRLVGAGADGAFGTADDVSVDLVSRYLAGGRVVSLDLAGAFPAGGVYRLTVLGGAQTAVHDLSGLRFDGDGDGAPGGDYVRTFTVAADSVAPTVVGAWVDSSTWTAAFRNSLQTSGLGSAAYGFALAGGADQLKALPWSNLDRISVRFSENVIVGAAHLALAGVFAAGYDVLAMDYDATTFTATWTLADRLPADKLVLRLAAGTGGVTDLAGNRLDGEWSPGGLLPSGNGAAGGDYVYRLNVLPGDVTRNGGVNALDVLQVRSRLTATNRYSVFCDVNGDGRINVRDTAGVRLNLSNVLPAGDPPMIASASTLLNRQRGRPTVAGLLKSS
jgi:hypothetical protein